MYANFHPLPAEDTEVEVESQTACKTAIQKEVVALPPTGILNKNTGRRR